VNLKKTHKITCCFRALLSAQAVAVLGATLFLFGCGLGGSTAQRPNENNPDENPSDSGKNSKNPPDSESGDDTVDPSEPSAAELADDPELDKELLSAQQLNLQSGQLQLVPQNQAESIRYCFVTYSNCDAPNDEDRYRVTLTDAVLKGFTPARRCVRGAYKLKPKFCSNTVSESETRSKVTRIVLRKTP
jgi:hypothetical protein